MLFRRGKIFGFLSLLMAASLWGGLVFGKPALFSDGESSSLDTCIAYRSLDIPLDKIDSSPDTVYAFALHLLAHACDKQDILSVVEVLETVANRGHAEAALVLAEIFYVGDMLPVDLKRSEEYFERAAELGNHQAQHELGIVLLKEATGEHDRLKALYWLGMAANQDNGFSAYVLGMIHQTGMHGVAKDPCLALDWYQGAKLMGFPDKAGRHAKLFKDFNTECY